MDVMHFWWDYVPGLLFCDAHRMLTSESIGDSVAVVAHLVDSSTPPPPSTVAMRRVGTASEVSERHTLVGRSLGRVAAPREDRRYRRFCDRQVVASSPRIAHAHFGFTAAKVLDTVRRHRIPLVVTFYGNDASSLVRQPRWQERYRDLFSYTSRVLVLAEVVAERLAACGCPEDRLVLWRAPAGVELYPYAKRPTGRPTRLLTAARFVEKKGYPYLLDALRRLVDDGNDVSLTAIGYGPLRDHIASEVARLGLAGRVDLVDAGLDTAVFQDRFRAALRDHHVFVLPSIAATDGDDEGGPALSLVAAQAAGLPVVCTPFPGAELTVIDGVTGLVCKERDAGSLAATLARLVSDQPLRDVLGHAGSELVRRDFSLAAGMESLGKVYSEVAPLETGPGPADPGTSKKIS